MSLVEFNEWYGDKGEKLHIYRDEKWIAKHGFEAGQQSKQGEVDKLQTKIDEITKQRDSFIKAHHIYMNDVCEHKDKIDELQARVDEVLKVCDNLRTDLIRENHVEYDKGWKDCATSIYHQLKGNKDD